MRALVLNSEQEFPELQDVPAPHVGEADVLVKVSASGVNYADTMMRRGFYLEKPPFPHIPGFEYSGVVAETGRAAKQFKPGDRVMGIGKHTFAEYVAVPGASVMAVPEGLSDDEAAAFPVAYLTAMGMLRLSAHAERGETILIHAAAGGVGTAATQIAKHLGLRVIATASTEEKLALARRLGAHVTINYATGDFVPAVLEATGKRGADIILESIGGDFLERNVRVAAPFGRIVVFGLASGIFKDPQLGPMFFNSVTVSAFWIFSLLRYPDLVSRISAEVLQILRESQLKPVIGRTYPLECGTEAIRSMEARGSYGKLLLRP